MADALSEHVRRTYFCDRARYLVKVYILCLSRNKKQTSSSNRKNALILYKSLIIIYKIYLLHIYLQILHLNIFENILIF